MASAPSSAAELLDLVRKSGVADDRLDAWVKNNHGLPSQANALAGLLVQEGLITPFHARHMMTGKYKGFLLGQYRVLDQIGAGGMGVIFLAEHVSMKRRVAIKVLPADKATDEESRERFYREARIVAALDHPNVVHAFDIGQNGDTHYMVMEYIEGESLEQKLRRQGPFPLREAADNIAQAARGLQHAFERGLVHRDIKPGNLLLDRDGVIKVLDMGLARFFEENSNLTTELCSGSVIGTADYMAPEQAVNSHDVDIRADIYSLGVTLYALLTGEPPYAKLTVPQKLLAHHMRTPEPIQEIRSDIPDGLAQIVEIMLAKKPEHRYQTPGEVADALAEWLKEDEVSQAPTAKNEKTIIQPRYEPLRAPAKMGSSRWKIPALAAGVVLLAGVAVAVVANSGGDSTKKVANPDAAKPPSSDPTTKSTTSQAKTTNTAVDQKPVERNQFGQVRKLEARTEYIEQIAVSPDGKWLVGGNRGGGLRVWDLRDLVVSQPMREFKGHNGVITTLAYSPDGKFLASCGQDGLIIVWDTSTWKEHHRLTGIKGQAWSCAFSPDSSTIFGGGDDGVGRFWSVATGQQPRVADQLIGKAIISVAWSPDGQMVYTASLDIAVRGYEAATGKQRFKFEYPPEKRFHFLAVSPDSAYVACCGESQGFHLINARTGVRVGQFRDDRPVTQWRAAFSSSSDLLVSTGNDKFVRVWDVETRTLYGEKLAGHTDTVPCCAISPDGRTVYSASKDKTVRVWAIPPR
jgi:serine/threonine protein kinase